jgi:hypothetical protein
MKKILFTLIAIIGFTNFATSQEFTVSSGTDKFVMLEVSVGANEQNVPDAYSRQTVLRSTYPKLIIVNNHNNFFGLTPLKFSTNDQWLSNYITAIPTGTVDRVGAMAIQRGNWSTAISAVNTTPKYQVSVTVKKIGPQILKVLVIGKALASLTGEYRFNVMITEDSLIQNQASTSGTLTNFPHKDVLRAYLGSEWGIYKCNNPTLNQIDTMGFIYTIPNSSNLKNLKIIGMIQKYSTDLTQREIMNAIATPLLDTSTSGFNSSSGFINNSSYIIEDTLLCKGKPLSFFLKNAQLSIGSTIVQSAIGTQGLYSIPFDSSKTISIKDSLGFIIKTINILVADNIILQRTTPSNTLNICGFATKFGIGATTNYSGSKSFNWFRNDTLLANTNAIDSFVNAGSYKLRATNFAGCKSELSFTINKLNNVFNPDFASNKQNATTTPFDFTFSNNTTPLSDYNFTWSWGDGNTSQNNNLINFYTYTSNGTYSVKLVAQNKLSGCKDSIVKANYITCSGGTTGVLALNTNKINPSCYGESNGSITVNVFGGTTPYQYKLNTGSYQSNNTFSNLGAGIYTVYVKDATNTIISKTDTLINPAVLAVGGILGSNGVPVGSTQNYNIASQNGVIYTWNIINGTLLSGNGTNSIQVQWAAVSGMGKVIANIAKNSCSSADTLVVSIGSNPLTLSTIKTDETCAGKANGAITINAAGGTTPYLYAINNGTYQPSNTFSNLVAGIYVSKVKDASNVIAQKTDTIIAGPGITAGAMNGPTNVALNALSTYLIAQQTGATMAWTASNGIVVGGQGTNIAQVSWGAAAGLGMVKVKVTSAAGCIDSTILDVTIGSTNISSISSTVNSLKVYPNPASTLLHIDFEKPGYYTAKLSSVAGQSVISPTTGTIDIAALANGVYILTIFDYNNKLISTNKVAIVK